MFPLTEEKLRLGERVPGFHKGLAHHDHHLLHDRSFLQPLCSRVVPTQSNRETRSSSQLNWEPTRSPILFSLAKVPALKAPWTPWSLLSVCLLLSSDFPGLVCCSKHTRLNSPCCSKHTRLTSTCCSKHTQLTSPSEPLLILHQVSAGPLPTSFWGPAMHPMATPLHLCIPSAPEHSCHCCLFVSASPTFSIQFHLDGGSGM